jgi:hypothetical protein
MGSFKIEFTVQSNVAGPVLHSYIFDPKIVKLNLYYALGLKKPG